MLSVFSGVDISANYTKASRDPNDTTNRFGQVALTGPGGAAEAKSTGGMESDSDIALKLSNISKAISSIDTQIKELRQKKREMISERHRQREKKKPEESIEGPHLSPNSVTGMIMMNQIAGTDSSYTSSDSASATFTAIKPHITPSPPII